MGVVDRILIFAFIAIVLTVFTLILDSLFVGLLLFVLLICILFKVVI